MSTNEMEKLDSDELARFRGGACADCGAPLIEGPHGGLSVNWRCGDALCGSGFNDMGPFGVERITVREPNRTAKVVYRTIDGLGLCQQHALELAGYYSGLELMSVLSDEKCGMCGVRSNGGNAHCDNEACQRRLHPQWPAVYCSNRCAEEDA